MTEPLTREELLARLADRSTSEDGLDWDALRSLGGDHLALEARLLVVEEALRAAADWFDRNSLAAPPVIRDALARRL